VTDLRLSLRLTADGRDLVGTVKVSKQEIERLGGGMDRAARKARRFSTETARTTKKLSTMRREVHGLRAALASLGVGLAVRDIVRAGVRMEGLRNALKAVSGSAELAGEALAFVREESDRLGLNFVESADAFSKLAAAAKGTALEGQGVRDIFTAVAEASRVMNLSAEETRGALNALAQMMSKGNVQAEELRGQLGERIPGAFQLAARAMGVSTSKLNDMLDKGEILAEDLLPKLAAELRQSFGAGVEDASNSAAAAFERAGNALFELKVAVADAGIVDLLADIASGWTKLAPVIKRVVVEFRDLADLAGAWAAVLAAVASGDLDLARRVIETVPTKMNVKSTQTRSLEILALRYLRSQMVQ